MYGLLQAKNTCMSLCHLSTSYSIATVARKSIALPLTEPKLATAASAGVPPYSRSPYLPSNFSVNGRPFFFSNLDLKLPGPSEGYHRPSYFGNTPSSVAWLCSFLWCPLRLATCLIITFTSAIIFLQIFWWYSLVFSLTALLLLNFPMARSSTSLLRQKFKVPNTMPPENLPHYSRDLQLFCPPFSCPPPLIPIFLAHIILKIL